MARNRNIFETIQAVVPYFDRNNPKDIEKMPWTLLSEMEDCRDRYADILYTWGLLLREAEEDKVDFTHIQNFARTVGLPATYAEYMNWSSY